MRRALFILTLCCACLTVCFSQRNPDTDDLNDWSYGEKKNNWKGTNTDLPVDMPFDKDGNLIYLGILKSGGTKAEQIEKIKKFITTTYESPETPSPPPFTKGSTTYLRRKSEIEVNEIENTVTCKLYYYHSQGLFTGVEASYTLRFYLKRDKCKYELIVTGLNTLPPGIFMVKKKKWYGETLEQHFEATYAVFSGVIQNVDKPRIKKDDW